MGKYKGHIVSVCLDDFSYGKLIRKIQHKNGCTVSKFIRKIIVDNIKEEPRIVQKLNETVETVKYMKEEKHFPIEIFDVNDKEYFRCNLCRLEERYNDERAIEHIRSHQRKGEY